MIISRKTWFRSQVIPVCQAEERSWVISATLQRNCRTVFRTQIAALGTSTYPMPSGPLWPRLVCWRNIPAPSRHHKRSAHTSTNNPNERSIKKLEKISKRGTANQLISQMTGPTRQKKCGMPKKLPLLTLRMRSVCSKDGLNILRPLTFTRTNHCLTLITLTEQANILNILTFTRTDHRLILTFTWTDHCLTLTFTWNDHRLSLIPLAEQGPRCSSS